MTCRRVVTRTRTGKPTRLATWEDHEDLYMALNRLQERVEALEMLWKLFRDDARKGRERVGNP